MTKSTPLEESSFTSSTCANELLMISNCFREISVTTRPRRGFSFQNVIFWVFLLEKTVWSNHLEFKSYLNIKLIVQSCFFLHTFFQINSINMDFIDIYLGLHKLLYQLLWSQKLRAKKLAINPWPKLSQLTSTAVL